MKVGRVLVLHPSCTLCCRKCEVFMSIYVQFDIRMLLELNKITDVSILLLLIHTHQFLAASKERLFACIGLSVKWKLLCAQTCMRVHLCVFVAGVTNEVLT